MTFTGTCIVYGIVGLVVAAALLLREESPGALRAVFLFASGVVFWPLYAPFLLGERTAQPTRTVSEAGGLLPRIRSAEERLLAALSKVSGVAEEVLAPEVARVRGLASSLVAMAKRLEEMDEMLATPEFSAAAAESALADLQGRGKGEDDARVQSVRARLRNVDRLAGMRGRTCEDLERALLKMEEMSSQMLLLKFAGRPDDEVVRLMKDIARSVEEVTEGLLAAC